MGPTGRFSNQGAIRCLRGDVRLARHLRNDIVDSTRIATELGDHRWRQLLEDHQRLTRAQLDRFEGREIKTTGDGFLAVHVAARIAALAGPGVVLTSRTVRDLAAGSGIAFEPRGRHALKGVAEEWDVYAIGAAPTLPPVP